MMTQYRCPNCGHTESQFFANIEVWHACPKTMGHAAVRLKVVSPVKEANRVRDLLKL